MSKDKSPRQLTVKGNKLQWSICSGTYFTYRKSMLNTRTLSFLNLDWANKNADNYICNKCGYIFWFAQQ